MPAALNCKKKVKSIKNMPEYCGNCGKGLLPMYYKFRRKVISVLESNKPHGITESDLSKQLMNYRGQGSKHFTLKSVLEYLTAKGEIRKYGEKFFREPFEEWNNPEDNPSTTINKMILCFFEDNRKGLLGDIKNHIIALDPPLIGMINLSRCLEKLVKKKVIKQNGNAYSL
ncbi:hypothetical protein AVEN_247177-1 [Araneus ventricosus]|uniref:Uncharacterized protein n=1 Tax=Araneus ventricosus TaxID=182803 RepID=A0A4Y2SXJ5_ARAVE|nr:hypothetical protein AVEN_69921-1 [Araneus ventricosus]GBO21123.1 hypothetical protein AVEN_247177-1 [Araneus ventricosus]